MINTVSAWLGMFYADMNNRLRREEGQALVEYGLILALIAVVSVAVLVTLGTDIRDALQKIVDKI